MVPIASMEQHGPHLPLATDTIQADEITRRAAERAKVLYTPCVWFGYSPQHMYDPGGGTGTITVRSQILLEVYHDVARSLVHHGFNRLVFVNNHGSNVKIIDPLLRRIRYETGAFVAFSKLYAERYLGLVSDVMENPPEETPGWLGRRRPGSGSRRQLVRMDRAVNQRVKADWFPDSFIKLVGPGGGVRAIVLHLFPTDHADFTPSGVIRNPFRATAERGEDVRAPAPSTWLLRSGVPEGSVGCTRGNGGTKRDHRA
jgi:creatinine amidohydrolase